MAVAIELWTLFRGDCQGSLPSRHPCSGCYYQPGLRVWKSLVTHSWIHQDGGL